MATAHIKQSSKGIVSQKITFALLFSQRMFPLATPLLSLLLDTINYISNYICNAQVYKFKHRYLTNLYSARVVLNWEVEDIKRITAYSRIQTQTTHPDQVNSFSSNPLCSLVAQMINFQRCLEISLPVFMEMHTWTAQIWASMHTHKCHTTVVLPFLAGVRSFRHTN